MPLYAYHCRCGNAFDEFRTLLRYKPIAICRACGLWAGRTITAPLMVKAQQECRYDSPIDGTPITSWAARRNDLAKHNCQEYDPEQKTDYVRRQKESQQQFDQSIDTQVEAAIEKMPTGKRAKLYSELTDQGVTAEVARGSA